jgi:predicted O-methyltransferase YrrM
MRPEAQNPREHYVESLYAREDEGLKAIRERLVTAGRWGVNISANEGRLLQVLMQMNHVKNVVEIVTLFGYSGVWIARALPQDGRLYTIERDHDCIRMARNAFEDCGVSDRVTLLEGEAIDKLKELEKDAPFDMVFIDANKSAYVEYLDWASKCVRKGGLIIADNTLLGGGVAESEKPENLSQRQWSEMRRFNEAIADRRQFLATIIPTWEGLTVAVRV